LVALRSVAADPSHELRQRVLGLLAREQDGFAVQTLLNGLTDPSKALLPPEKALQLLGNDPHAEVYDVARRIADSPPNPTARREALRVLGSDAASAPLFESLLADRAEDSDVRQLSSAVLNAVAPDRLQATARRVVLDPNEDAAVKAACLTALTQFGKPEQVLQDKDLLDRVSEIGSQSKGAMRRQAQQFLNKYRR
jgi:hypothetical protein